MSKSSRFCILSFMMVSLTIAAFIQKQNLCKITKNMNSYRWFALFHLTKPVSLKVNFYVFFNSIKRFFILYNIKVYISDKKFEQGLDWYQEKKVAQVLENHLFCVISQIIFNLMVLFNVCVLIAMLLMDTIPVVVFFQFPCSNMYIILLPHHFLFYLTKLFIWHALPVQYIFR